MEVNFYSCDHDPSFVKTKKVMNPLWDIQKSNDPPPAYAPIMIIPNNNTKK